MIRNILLAIITTLLFSGCSKMYFHNGEPSNSVTLQNEQTHRHTVFNLVEISDPINLNEKCPSNDWDTIETELSFLDFLISSIDNFLIGVDVYGQKTVNYSCSK